MGATMRREGDLEGGNHYSYGGIRKTRGIFCVEGWRGVSKVIKKEAALTRSEVLALNKFSRLDCTQGEVDAKTLAKMLPGVEKIAARHKEKASQVTDPSAWNGWAEEYEIYVEPFLLLVREAVEHGEGIWWS